MRAPPGGSARDRFRPYAIAAAAVYALDRALRLLQEWASFAPAELVVLSSGSDPADSVVRVRVSRPWWQARFGSGQVRIVVAGPGAPGTRWEAKAASRPGHDSLTFPDRPRWPCALLPGGGGVTVPQPGQFVVLYAPGVSRWEAHPFSLTSTGDANTLELRARGRGDYTAALVGRANNLHHTSSGRDRGDANDSASLNVTLEGPYGRALVLPRNHTTAICVVGGIGTAAATTRASGLSWGGGGAGRSRRDSHPPPPAHRIRLVHVANAPAHVASPSRAVDVQE